ncbi:hypothetical protein H7849_24760 [Alloacidobacterium dinghuense]|uniref:Uncharacterized protein n=2 Tax=Alloacidobacterium dinghuense TaxID=2763107 RepID=A0A7G8BRL1_9BACT|nr:hypothetical protein H7849_24760 [Alloacidobacterium dinghuense]
MHMTPCTDQVIGDILSSWRYDISGISPEMRVDYEQHFVECQHCHSRQRLHRTVDVTLIGLATISMLAFLLALSVIHRVEPLRNWAVMNLHLHQIDVVLTLQAAAVVGLLISALAWVLVAIATPAPVYITGVAMAQARELQNRLPRKAA